MQFIQHLSRISHLKVLDLLYHPWHKWRAFLRGKDEAFGIGRIGMEERLWKV